MNPQDLDGRYRVSTVTDYTGPIPMKSDGETVVKDGKTDRTDAAGCHWSTTLRFINENEVEFVSIADPTNAQPDFCLKLRTGQLTRDPVTYTAILKVARKDDKIKLSGEIDTGNVKTLITMMKIV